MSVPEQVAILGVDNDDLICRLCTPPLSSVMPNAEAVGFRAAETLAKLMDGQQDVQPVSLLPPIGIATRQSTDVVAINDRAVADALQYIRLHACEGLTVDEVVGANKVSRSTLERQVRKFLRRTPQEEIRRVQVNRAQELLMTTKLSLEKIAPMCGFEHPEYLHVVFKRVTGQTPGEFRKDAISNESTSSSRTDV
jgi:LacI family transcriptional regulator